jgi:ABC-type sugar transport system ATPase subunit
MVTHNLTELFQAADRALVLKEGKTIWCGPLCGLTPGDLAQMMFVGRSGVPDYPDRLGDPKCPVGDVRVICIVTDEPTKYHEFAVVWNLRWCSPLLSGEHPKNSKHLTFAQL